MRGGAVILLLATALPTGSRFAASPGAPRVRIVAPVSTRVAVGPTPILAEVEAAAGRRIKTVHIYADGILMATLFAPPWQAVFDAGTAIRGHSLRIEAVDDLGTKGRAIGTTLYLPFIEEVEVRGDVWKPGTVAVNVLDKEDQPLRDVAARELSARLSLRSAKVESAVLDTRPLVVELMFDVSGSTIPYHVMMRRAAERFISTLQPEDSQEVLLFAGATHRLSPFGHDHVEARRAILAEDLLGPVDRLGGLGTRLYDALVTAIESVNPQAGQRSILILTDTFDTDSLTSWEEIREVVRHAGIRIDLFRYGGVPITAGWSVGRRLAERCETLVQESGGMQWRVRDPEDLAPAFSQLARMLRARYRVQVGPQDPLARGWQGWRRLDLDVRRKGCWVLAPAGIFFPAPWEKGAAPAARKAP